MANETIELLKNYTPEKMTFPAGMQVKLDGVPMYVYRDNDGEVYGLSRQGTRITSVQHIIEAARPILLVPGAFIVGEIYSHLLPFKDISGQVRDTKAQHPNLSLHVFDACLDGNTQNGWFNRHKHFAIALSVAIDAQQVFPNKYPIKIIPQLEITEAGRAEAILDLMKKQMPKLEGCVLHSYSKPWQAGKRCWGTQRMKPQPTIDLEVVGFEEAVSEAGEPKGMVGRINVKFKSDVIGIGPGKMSHEDRKYHWNYPDIWIGKICEIKYMPDDTYDALRQPTFQRWRHDKTVSDA